MPITPPGTTRTCDGQVFSLRMCGLQGSSWAGFGGGRPFLIRSTAEKVPALKVQFPPFGIIPALWVVKIESHPSLSSKWKRKRPGGAEEEIIQSVDE